MKRIVIACLLVASLAGTAYGQAGTIFLWSDAAHTSCDTQNTGTLFWYLTWEGHNGGKAVQFKVEAHGNFIHVADTWNTPLAIGDAGAGVALSFTGCLSSPIDLGSTIWTGLGTAGVCATVDVVPDPTAPTGQIEAADCTDAKIFPNGSTMTVQSDGSCSCGAANPVEETNWGRIKALYN